MNSTSTAIIDLGRLFPRHDGRSAPEDGPTGLRIEGHLPECPHRHRPAVGCDWCLSELSNAGVRRCADLARDARALIEDHDRRCGDVSVAWVVAAGGVLDSAAEGAEGTLVVGSVIELRERVHRMLLDEVAPLRRRIDLAVAPGGSVESRCVRSAALLTTSALQRPELSGELAALPSHVRAAIDATGHLLSANARTSGLLAVAESIHWDGLPLLRTQPDWRRTCRPEPTTTSVPSLEALVMEATTAEITERVTAIVSDLLAAADPVRHRLAHRVELSSPTRALTLRMGRIDWTRTFVDSGRSRCWLRDRCSILIPWVVAVALDEGDRMGLTSATHGDAPDVGRRRA